MTLQQLRYLSAVVQNGLSITAAARRLRTSQPSVSKQIKLLERELGFNIFVRSRRTLTGVTSSGQHVIERAQRMLRDAQSIKGISADLRHGSADTLSIGTTHTQARYVLPPVIKKFIATHPNIQLHLHQGTSEQIAEMVRSGRLDLAIATGAYELFPQLVMLPCYQWHRRIIVPRDHPLAAVSAPTLAQLASYPLVTYAFSFNGTSSLHERFGQAALRANVALAAHDADVIKTYVRLRLGVGIVASMAYDAQEDADLVSIDASHLFQRHITWIGFPRGIFLRRHLHDFMHLMAPHLDRTVADRAADCDSPAQVAALFSGQSLPER